ncbi:PREDICTED: legumin B-like [Nelumbo nucifera]|uniref:Legumin B-like n=1 Tax=Nelumbo nucifera TaxID=4432 RepID=A0A1U7ZIX9_NELNU|nr:PREDICTED: legumin B-like [Nelumbo nucifera]
MVKSALLFLSLCFLVLCHVCVAYRHSQQQSWQRQQHQQQRRFRGQRECQVQDLSALEPNTRIESEGGVTEYWEENNQQLKCAGVAVIRHVIEPKGLLLPSYTNAPKLTYIVQGRGFTGVVFPGCPETYQSFQQSQQSEGNGGSRRYEDFHQKIRNFHQGDVIAYPAGVAHWCYNDGDTPVIAVTVIDTSNNANQLDQNLRKFQLAGNQENQQENTSQQKSTNNIFSGFDIETLAEAFGVSTKTARKLQGHDDDRGEIVLVNDGLGNARSQIVGENGSLVFDGELCEGQLLVVPQNFAVLTQAVNEEFRWISFKTSDNAWRSALAGRNSIMRAMPEEVLMNSYHISREEARNLKYNQEQMEVLSPRTRSWGQPSA